MITISREAAQKILQSMPPAQIDSPHMSLRVAAKRLADGSFDYAMGWDAPNQHDTRSQSNGVAIIVAPTSIEFLHEATLDYVELIPGEHQFIFSNPNDPTHTSPQKTK